MKILFFFFPSLAVSFNYPLLIYFTYKYLKNYKQIFEVCIFLFFLFPAASMFNPYSNYHLFRNQEYNKQGKFLRLTDFLNLIKGQTSLLGAVIIIEVRFSYACYLSNPVFNHSISCRLCEHVIFLPPSQLSWSNYNKRNVLLIVALETHCGLYI